MRVMAAMVATSISPRGLKAGRPLATPDEVTITPPLTILPTCSLVPPGELLPENAITVATELADECVEEVAAEEEELAMLVTEVMAKRVLIEVCVTAVDDVTTAVTVIAFDELDEELAEGEDDDDSLSAELEEDVSAVDAEEVDEDEEAEPLYWMAAQSLCDSF